MVDQSSRTREGVDGIGERLKGPLGACPTSETDTVLSVD